MAPGPALLVVKVIGAQVQKTLCGEKGADQGDQSPQDEDRGEQDGQRKGFVGGRIDG